MSHYITPEDFKVAEANGLDRQLVHSRVYHRGWSVQRAITQPVKEKRPKRDWKYLHKRLEENGIPLSTFYTRVNQLGMTSEKASSMPVKDMYNSWRRRI